jgi:beta-alanine degradation protein BauB
MAAQYIHQWIEDRVRRIYGAISARASCYYPHAYQGGLPVTRKSLVLSVAAAVVIAVVVSGAQQDDALDPVRVAPDTHTLAFENMFVRVLDVRIPPGRTELRHRHPHGLSVYLTDWDAKVALDGQAPQVNHRKAGSFAWSEALIHTVQNVGTTEGHVFRIELKH